MGFKKDFLKNIAKFGSYTYLVQVIEFGSTIILSRLISPSEYGFVALITVFSRFVNVLSNVGTRHALIRNDYDNEKVGDFFGLNIWIGILLFIVFSLLAYPISLFYNNSKLIIPIIVMGIGFIVNTVSFVPNALASKYLKFDVIGKGRVLQTLISVLSMIILAFLNFSYWALILPLTFSPIIFYFYLQKKIEFKKKLISLKESWNTLLEIKSLVGNITTSHIINYWSRNADNLVIGKVFGESSLGLYNRAYRFIYIALRLITHIFGTVLFPSLKKLKDAGDHKIDKEFFAILGGISILNYPISFMLILFSEEIVRILWGNDWIGVAMFLPYIGILILTQTIFSASTDYYVLQKKERTVFILSVVWSSTTVSAILFGALFSVLHVILFYTIANQALILFQIYYGFYKSLGFSFNEIIRFWGAKFLLGTLLVYFIYYDLYFFQVITAVLYFSHIVYYQRQDLDKLLVMLRAKKKK